MFLVMIPDHFPLTLIFFGEVKVKIGWQGDVCSVKTCDPRCSAHGMCSNGTCLCTNGKRQLRNAKLFFRRVFCLVSFQTCLTLLKKLILFLICFFFLLKIDPVFDPFCENIISSSWEMSPDDVIFSFHLDYLNFFSGEVNLRLCSSNFTE